MSRQPSGVLTPLNVTRLLFLDLMAATNAMFVPLAVLLDDSGRRYFVLDSGVQRLHLASVVIEAALVCLVLCVLERRMRHRWWVKAEVAAFMAVSIAAWSILGLLFPVMISVVNPAFVAIGLSGWVVFGLAWFGIPPLRLMIRMCLRLFLASSCLFGIGHAAHLWVEPTPKRHLTRAGQFLVESTESGNILRPQPFAARLSPKPVKILWIIFDELDQRLAFESLPDTLELPAFQALARESLLCSSVTPSSYRTLSAIPSMLTGQLLSTVDAVRVRKPTASASFWGTLPNLFSEFHEQGINTAVLGWYHPYCSVLGNSLDHCWALLDDIEPYVGQDKILAGLKFDMLQIARQLPAQRALRRLVMIQRGADVSQQSSHRERVDLVEAQLDRFLTYEPGFVVVHLPLPHPPGLGPAGPGDYFDNLILGDQILDRIRRELELAHSWEDTTVVVTGDHHFRLGYWDRTLEAGMLSERVRSALGGKDSFRVACLMKFPAQHTPERYPEGFNAVLLHDLLKAVAAGALRSAPEAKLWLDRNRGRFGTAAPPVE